MCRLSSAYGHLKCRTPKQRINYQSSATPSLLWQSLCYINPEGPKSGPRRINVPLCLYFPLTCTYTCGIIRVVKSRKSYLCSQHHLGVVTILDSACVILLGLQVISNVELQCKELITRVARHRRCYGSPFATLIRRDQSQVHGH